MVFGVYFPLKQHGSAVHNTLIHIKKHTLVQHGYWLFDTFKWFFSVVLDTFWQNTCYGHFTQLWVSYLCC